MWWHTVTHGRGSEGETLQCSRYPVLFTLPRNTVYPALLPLMRTPRLPAVDWTDATHRPIEIDSSVSPERRKLVSARIITFQTRSNNNPMAGVPNRLAISVKLSTAKRLLDRLFISYLVSSCHRETNLCWMWYAYRIKHSSWLLPNKARM